MCSGSFVPSLGDKGMATEGRERRRVGSAKCSILIHLLPTIFLLFISFPPPFPSSSLLSNLFFATTVEFLLRLLTNLSTRSVLLSVARNCSGLNSQYCQMTPLHTRKQRRPTRDPKRVMIVRIGVSSCNCCTVAWAGEFLGPPPFYLLINL